MNKTGSNTVPVERRPDFKQALSTLQQLKQKDEGAQKKKSTMGTEFFFFLLVELARFLVDSLFLLKVTMEMNQVLIEQGDLLYKYLEQFFRA